MEGSGKRQRERRVVREDTQRNRDRDRDRDWTGKRKGGTSTEVVKRWYNTEGTEYHYSESSILTVRFITAIQLVLFSR